ncbi:MAG: M48 family metalloprotease [Candidatus Ruthia sp.]|nr:M48 family metalloprotease [Candidatus Ruthturnera sp.]MBT6922010.1 M48 family metalloprotease [Candidatus Ruthturnera sp.]
MIKNLSLLLLTPFLAFALSIPELQLPESLSEKKRGNEFLQLIWNTDSVVADVEMTTYLRDLGHELGNYSENPDKHFGFLLLNDDSINAFAGPYGYIGVHTGMLLSSDSESELAGVLSHEISHVTQNHLKRFSEKTDKQTYLMVAGMLAAALVDNPDASQAIAASTVAGTAQQSINFTREHEWEADRIGTAMLSKSGFDPQGMAHFFEKLKDSSGAQEFLRSHPLSINRISDSMQRAARASGDYREDSFEYITTKAKLYYHKHGRIKLEQDKVITNYMQAYQAFEDQDYSTAKTYVDQLLKLNHDKPSNILAGRIASKLGDIETAQQYFDQNNLIEDDEASLYYAAQAYLDNQQPRLGVATLKPFLRVNKGSYQSYQLLSSLFVELGNFDRSHIQSAKALIVQGKLDKAIGHYERAKAVTHSQDLFDVLSVRIDSLQQTLDLYKDLPD